MLEYKDTSAAHKALQELEQITKTVQCLAYELDSDDALHI